MEAVKFAIDKHIIDKNICVFDTKAESMAPAIAMLFQKYRGEFYDFDYEKSKEIFKGAYPAFNPKQGIEAVLKELW